MKRRNFLLSGSASVAFAVTGCGGGGESETAVDSAATAAPSALASSSVVGPLGRAKSTVTAARGTTTTTTPTTTTTTTTTASTSSTTTPAAGTGGYPFGARKVAYIAGIHPTQTNAAMDAVLTKQYDAWKAARVVSAASVVSGGYAVQFSDVNYMTVSEGMGYGMLLAVLFAGHDPQAKALFDGMLAVVRARPAYAMTSFSSSGAYLMDWRVAANGASAGDGWNAMDGDLDIAYALLLADKQWGSTGTWNYLVQAKNTIAGLKFFNFAADGTTKGLATTGVSRTSDYMLGHFRAFKAATGDALWDLAVDRAISLTDRMQTVYSPGAGLVPDFIVATNTTSAIPSPGFMGDGTATEGYFYWNACRNPWRLGSDYVLSGDARVAVVTGRMVDFFQRSSGGNPQNIASGNKLDGTVLGAYADAAFIGPAGVGAMVDARFQTFLNSIWNWNVSSPTTGYYDSEIQLLSMVVMSGNWWTPSAVVAVSAPASAPSQAPAPAPAPAAACTAATWNSTTRYMPGDTVLRNGTTYTATAKSATTWNVNSPPEWTPSLWALGSCSASASAPAPAPTPAPAPVPAPSPAPAPKPSCSAAAWNATTRYLGGDRVLRNGVLYTATALSSTVWNVNSPPEFTPTYWSVTVCA